MAVSGLKTLFVAIANAVTYELVINLPITYIVNRTGPWTAEVNAFNVGLLLFIMVSVTYIVRHLLGNITTDELRAAFVTLLSFLVPWLVLRLLWRPGNLLICCMAKKKTPCRPCLLVVFLKIVRLVICGLCLYTTFHRNGLGKCWQQGRPTGGYGNNPGIPYAGNRISNQPSSQAQPQAQAQPQPKPKSKPKPKPKSQPKPKPKSQPKPQPQPQPALRKSLRPPKPTHCFFCG